MKQTKGNSNILLSNFLEESYKVALLHLCTKWDPQNGYIVFSFEDNDWNYSVKKILRLVPWTIIIYSICFKTINLILSEKPCKPLEGYIHQILYLLKIGIVGKFLSWIIILSPLKVQMVHTRFYYLLLNII